MHEALDKEKVDSEKHFILPDDRNLEISFKSKLDETVPSYLEVSEQIEGKYFLLKFAEN